MLKLTMKQFLLVAVLAANCRACNRTDAPKAVLEKSLYDLGRLTVNGAVKTIQVPVTNAGNKTLELDYRWSSCGCLEILSYDKQIEQGKTGFIRLGLDPSSGNLGYNLHELGFTTNDPALPIAKISVSYILVAGDIIFTPEVIRFSIPAEKLLTNSYHLVDSVCIRDDAKQRLVLESIDFSDPNFCCVSYDTVCTTFCGKKIHRITLNVFVRNKIHVGRVDEKMILVTNRKSSPVIEIPIKGTIEPRITVTPQTIIIRDVAPGSYISREIKIESKTAELEIDGIELKHPWLKARQIRQDPHTAKIVITGQVPSVGSPKSKNLLEDKLAIEISKPDHCTKYVYLFLFEN